MKKQPKNSVIRIETHVKTDLILAQSLLPHQMFGEEIKNPGDVVKTLLRMWKEKKIGELTNSPKESDILISRDQEFKDLEWRCLNAEKNLDNSQKRFLFLCNLTGTDPKVIYEKFARR